MYKSSKALLEELKHFNGFTDSFVDALKDGFIILDTTGEIVIVNATFCQITGYKKQELLGLKAPFPFWPKKYHNKFIEKLKDVLQNNSKGEFKGVHLNKKGEEFPVIVYFSNIHNKKNQVIAHIVFVQYNPEKTKNNIFEDKEISSILNYRKKYFDLLVDANLVSQLDYTLNNISDGLITLDKNDRYTYVNKKAGDILGKAPSDIIGKKIWDVFPEAKNHAFYHIFDKAIKMQIKQDFQEYYKPLDKWFQNRIYPHPEGATIYFTEITEIKKIEKLLIDSEKNLENIINNIGDPVFVKDDKSRFVYVNLAFCEMLNISKDKIIGRTMAALVPKKENDNALNIDKVVLETGVSNTNIENLSLKGLKKRIISTKKNRIIDSKGNLFIVGVIRDITNIKEIESKLHAAKEYSESLIKSMRDGIIVFNKKTEIISVNPSFSEMTGFSEEELINKDCPYPFTPPETKDIYELIHSKIENGETIDDFENIYMRKDGTRFYVYIKISMVHDLKKGKPLYFAAVQDITGRKQAELKIKESEKALLIAQKIAKIGSFNLNLISKIAETSVTFNQIVGIKDTGLVSFEVWKSIVFPMDRIMVKNAMLNSQNTFEKFDLEYRILTKNTNELKWVHGLGEIIFENGIPTHFLGTIQDVTSRKNAEIELNKVNDFSSGLLHAMNEGMVAINLEAQIISVNPAFCKMTGFTEKELIGTKRPFPFSPPEFKKENDKRYKLLLQNKNKSKYENTYMRKNGERFPVLVSIASIYDENGNKTANFSTIQDITQRKKAVVDLQLAKDFNEELVMSMQEGLVIIDLEGEIIKVNTSTCDLLGYTKDELLGMTRPYPFELKKDFDLISKTYKKVLNGEFQTSKGRLIKKNGETFIASFTSGLIKNSSGEVIALFATLKDISEEEKTKKILKQVAIKSTRKKDVILKLANLVGEDFSIALNKITKLAAQTLHVERVSVWSFNKDKSEITCQKLYVLNKNKHEYGNVLKYEDNPKYFKALEKKQTIIIRDAQEDSVTKQFSKDYLIPNNITSLMDVFINSANGYYGIICFEHVGAFNRDWSAEEQEFATSIASVVSLMVESNERKEAEKELKSEKEFSEELITSLKTGLSVVDLNGVHIKVNAALCNMTGFKEEELLGIKAPFPYWPPEEYDNIYKAFNNPLESLSSNHVFTLMRKNGERFPASFSDSTIKNKEGEIIAYFATINDITSKVKAENVLKENIAISNKRKNIIIELANLIGEDFNASLKKIATTAANALDVALVTIWEYKDNNNQLLSKLFYNANKNYYESEKLILKREDYPEYFNAFINKASINIPNVVTNPITKAFTEKYFAPNHISSRIDVVIYGRAKNYGIISFECKKPYRIFTTEEESFATSIASIVSLMVESNQRTLAENKIVLTNQKLLEANKELNDLREQLEQENVYLRNELDLVFNYEEMVYGSTAFSNVLTEVEKVAPTNATVLLLGESGTGKELLARAIHNISKRNNKPLIKVNCSAIPRELIESELFGHKKGSFTGAFTDKVGKFELADGGTLFLDEIGELPLDMQPKILRFLQEGEIEVVGGVGSKTLDVRVIAATNRNLEEEIKKKQFREDLYFRLNVFPILVPALRERKEDVPLLVEHFVNKFSKAYDKQVKYISDEAMTKLKAYKWPGNIRELENLIERALILSTGDTLTIPGFETSSQKTKKRFNSKDTTLEAVSRNHIYQVLENCNWKISGVNSASELLGLKPSTLRDKMTKLNIKKPS